VLTYVEQDGTSFHSVGDVNRRGHVQFLCCGQMDDFMLEMAIPEKVALLAAEEFVLTQRMPASVAWEADF
jgi:hypothetical protein